MLTRTGFRILGPLMAMGLSLVFGAGCLDDDVGTCCTTLDEDRADLIPVPPDAGMGVDGGPSANVIRQDPAFDCSGLTCTAYQGSRAFCTRQCEDDAECPEGFSCRPVLESDPGPGSMLSPDDRFCVRDAHDCTNYEP